MFGIPISEDQPATVILCDNESVVKNTSNVESSLNKNQSDIAYHFSRWNVAAGVCTIAWMPTGENIADAMTKILSKAVRDYLFGKWTYLQNGFAEVRTIFYPEGTVCLCHHQNY